MEQDYKNNVLHYLVGDLPQNSGSNIPNFENTFLSMYKKFNTFYKKDIAKTQSGIEFLTSNKLANVKHGEIEYITPLSYTVNVSNGKFDSFGKEHSTLH